MSIYYLIYNLWLYFIFIDFFEKIVKKKKQFHVNKVLRFFSFFPNQTKGAKLKEKNENEKKENVGFWVRVLIILTLNS